MDQGVTLSNILKSFTVQPDQMWYLVWEGYGSELSETLAERPHRRYLAYRGEIGDSREEESRCCYTVAPGKTFESQ